MPDINHRHPDHLIRPLVGCTASDLMLRSAATCYDVTASSIAAIAAASVITMPGSSCFE